jgi:hypothetical protein
LISTETLVDLTRAQAQAHPAGPGRSIIVPPNSCRLSLDRIRALREQQSEKRAAMKTEKVQKVEAIWGTPVRAKKPSTCSGATEPSREAMISVTLQKVRSGEFATRLEGLTDLCRLGLSLTEAQDSGAGKCMRRITAHPATDPPLSLEN